MSAANNPPVREVSQDQDRGAIEKIAADVAPMLTQDEHIFYVALQNSTALSMAKDAVLATNNRVIFYKPGMLGRMELQDFPWKDVKDCHFNQGFLSSEFSVETVHGQRFLLGNLNKEQTKRLYAICQQIEEEWREKRRLREMEENRARAGGIYVGTSTAAAPAQASEDPLEKLAKAKKMLDMQLISQEEFDALKAKILQSL